jgi:hypothetical protein
VYTGDDTSTIFPFTFRVFDDTDLVVTLHTIADGTETVLALTTDYTVDIDGEAGGDVTLTASLSSSYKLIIQRVLPLTQEADYVANDPFPAETHEEVADRGVMLSQQLKEEVDRSIKMDATQSGVSVTLPIPEASKVIGWNATADAFENYDNAQDALDGAVAAQAAAEVAQTAAELAETNAEIAETNAELAQVAAETAATNAETWAGGTQSVEFIIDGGGSAITTGNKGDIRFPYACTLSGVYLLADVSGSIVLDLWKDTLANFPPTVADTITASAKPTLSSATNSSDTTMTGWTKSITAGDIIRVNVDSVATVTRVAMILTFTRV